MTDALHSGLTWTGRKHWGAGEARALSALDPLLMAQLLDHIPAHVLVVARDHTCLYANHVVLDMFGLSAEQVIGRHVAEIAGRALFENYLRWADRLFGGESLRWQGWAEYPNRERCYLQQSIVPFAPGDGAVEAIVVFSRDLTELKLREEELAARLQALQTSEALKLAIVDNALVALISTDAVGRIVEFNPAAEAMFGRARADVLGRAISAVAMPERFHGPHDAGLRRLAEGAAPRVLGKRLELHALRADGTEFPIEMVLWRTDVGATGFYTASIIDVTERQNAALQIERQREALRHSEKLSAMGSLLAGVAHELNNPLAIVMGRASLLEAKTEDSALRADATRIREAAERCARIVRTFLAMARQRPSVRQPVLLNDLVRGAVELLKYNLRTSGIEVELRLADNLPEAVADADQLGQVVLNLLVNAQQAMAGAPAPLRVRLETGVELPRPDRPARVWLRVADNGPGVAESHRERIFDPFFTTKPEGAGTGLGLAVSRSLAREHGGELLLERGSPVAGTPTAATAAAGSGASFRLSLPVALPEPVAQAAPVAAAGEAAAAARVLVVDDEAELASLIRDVLEAAQLEVATAESGEVALALLATARFDAVVTDLRMPGMDGAALWREIRTRQPALAQRVVFVTGDTLSVGAQRFLAETGCACIDKPFTPAELLARVEACLAALPSR